jgi:hypothetical protein
MMNAIQNTSQSYGNVKSFESLKLGKKKAE